MIINGLVDRIIYNSNDFTVFTIKTNFFTNYRCQANGGLCNSIKIGQNIKVEGEFIQHEKYGKQFKVLSFFNSKPLTPDGCYRWLSTLDGVGETTINRIKEFVGDEIIEILNSGGKELKQVYRLGALTLEMILTEWKKIETLNADTLNVDAELQKLEFTENQIKKIKSNLKTNVLQQIKDNPYCSLSAILSFPKIDALVQKHQLANSTVRLTHGIEYYLKSLIEQTGSTRIEKYELVTTVKEKLKFGLFSIDEIINEITNNKFIVQSDGNEYIGWKSLTEKELFIKNKPQDHENCLCTYNSAINNNPCFFDNDQITAITELSKTGDLIITGGAGTGKTTLIKEIINILQSNNLSFALCSPTGKAAKRISEKTEHEAKTIHRLLEVDGEIWKKTGKVVFVYNKDRKLPYGVVIVDESSMIDSFLMYSLLSAISPSGKVVLIGDANQLPPVSAGQPFKDLINKINTAKLNILHRQEKGNEIIDIAYKILNQQKLSEFDFKGSVELRQVQDFNLDDYDKTNSIILSPVKVGDTGVNNLNELCQFKLNSANVSSDKFWNNDLVMQTANNYKKGVFNGDIGIYISNRGNSLIRFNIEDEVVSYTDKELFQLSLAYALTVHKSQGSEWENVWLIINPADKGCKFMLTRELLYTAVTRAKGKLIIYSDIETLNYGIQKSEGNRQTWINY